VSVRPDWSVMVPDTITGSRRPRRSNRDSIANTAALAFRVSNMVSKQNQVRAPVDEPGEGVGIGRRPARRSGCAEPRIVHVGRDRRGLVGGPEHPRDEARPAGIAVAAYADALAGLVDGGADLILLETIFDTLNAKAAVFAIESLFDRRGRRLPVIVSGTITDQSDARSPDRLPRPSGIGAARATDRGGLNCALGAKLMRPYIEELSNVADTCIAAIPTQGCRTLCRRPATTRRREYTSGLLKEFAESGFLNIVGGCCGTTPEHIRAIADAVRALPPRVPPGRREEAAPFGARTAQHRRRLALRQRRRAHQRHRLTRLCAPHPRGDYQEGLAWRANRWRTARS